MKKLTIIAILVGLSYTSFTQEKKTDEFKPTVNIGATVFTGWQYNMNSNFILKLDTSSAGVNPNVPFGYNPAKNQFEVSQNTFYLERAYINVLAALTPEINARLTPDIYSFADGSGNTQYSYQVKFAYFDYTPLLLDNGTSLTFTLGVNTNQWTSYIDRYYTYRFVAKSLTDYPWMTAAARNGNTVNQTTGSYFSSADLGLTMKFTVPKKYADLYVAVVDGNGFRNLSFDNRFKDVQVTGFIYPLAGMLAKKTDKMKKAGKTRLDGISELTLGGFAYLGKLNKGENYAPGGVQYVRNRFGGMITAKLNFKDFGYAKITGEYSAQANDDPASSKPDSLVRTNVSGLSFMLDFNPPVKSLNEKLFLMARYDMFDPNTTNDAPAAPINFNNNTDKQSLLILGLFYKPAKVLTFGFSYQMTTYQENYVLKYDGTTSKSLNRLCFNTLLNF